MGLIDKFKDLASKGEQLVAEHPGQIKDALEKAEQTVDQHTGGKYHKKIAHAAGKAEEFVDKQSNKGSSTMPSPPS